MPPASCRFAQHMRDCLYVSSSTDTVMFLIGTASQLRCITARGVVPVRAILAEYRQCAYGSFMATMNISLPDALQSFVDRQVVTRCHGR